MNTIKGAGGVSRACALILAAGQGKRMRSKVVKLLHEIGGRPVVSHVVATARAVPCRRIVAVLGVQGDQMRSAIEDGLRPGRGARVEFCTQDRQLGTAHAVLSAEKTLRSESGALLILSGDVPLVTAATLRSLLSGHIRSGAALSVVTAELRDPTGYGRVVRDADGRIAGIREQADIEGNEELEAIREINTGLYCADLEGLFDALKATSRSNAQQEYYLPDLVGVLRSRGLRVEAVRHPRPGEVLGINTRAELAEATRELFRRKAEELMTEGVTLVDPATTWVDGDVRVGPDTVLHPMVRLEGTTRIGSGCTVHPGTRIRDSVLADGVEILDHCLVLESSLGKGSRVGPFAHLRPGTTLGAQVHVGNFVETKKARIGERSKANHLSYLGDTIIGKDVNVGAGTITCNYDGWDKHTTVLGDGVFIGSDTQLVAPVKVGRGAFVGAGSTITKDVPADSLALSRAQQKTIEGWAARKRREIASRRKPAAKRSRRR